MFKSVGGFSKFNYNLKNIFQFQYFTFATKMRAGITKNKKDSAGRRLGLKKFGGEEVIENQIILRQRGFKWKTGENVHHGKDHTLHASKEGIVKFAQDPWSRRRRVIVSVVEKEVPNRKLYPPKPFMYHPELYPELASRNIEMEPLKIPQDEKHKIACSKRKVKSVEITKVSCTLNTLASNIEVASQFANRIDRDSFTNKHVIKPVLKEINEVGIKYFIPDYLSEIRYENELARQNYLEKMDNKYPSEMLHSNPEREMFAKGKVTNLLELYAKEIFLSNKSISVKDLVIEMKKVGQIDSAMDLRGLPEQENVFSELLKKRFILNNMIKKKQTLIEESKENQEETLKLTSELEIVKEEMEKVNKLLRRNVQKIYNKRRNFSNAIKTISERSKKKTIVRRKKVEKRIRI